MPREFNHIRGSTLFRLIEIHDNSDSYTKITVDEVIKTIYGLTLKELKTLVSEKDLIIDG